VGRWWTGSLVAVSGLVVGLAGCAGGGAGTARRAPDHLAAGLWDSVCQGTGDLTGTLERIEHGQLSPAQIASRLQTPQAALARDASAARAADPVVAGELRAVSVAVGLLADASRSGAEVVVPLARVFEAISRLPVC
jgi:hypothetical protein